MDNVFNDNATLINNSPVLTKKTETKLTRKLRDFAFISIKDFLKDTNKYKAIYNNNQISLYEEPIVSEDSVITNDFFTELFVNCFNNKFFSLKQYPLNHDNTNIRFIIENLFYTRIYKNFNLVYSDITNFFSYIKKSLHNVSFNSYIQVYHPEVEIKDELNFGSFGFNKIYKYFNFYKNKDRQFPIINFFNQLQDKGIIKLFSNIDINFCYGLDCDFLIKGIYLYILNDTDLSENSKLVRFYENESGLLINKNRDLLVSFEQNEKIDVNDLYKSNNLLLMIDVDMTNIRQNLLDKDNTNKNYIYVDYDLNLTSSIVDFELLLNELFKYVYSEDLLVNNKINFDKIIDKVPDLFNRYKDQSETKIEQINNLSFFEFFYTILISAAINDDISTFAIVNNTTY